MKNDIAKQRGFYTKSAHCYDDMCASDENDEHYIASAILSGFVSHFGIDSLVDVGCGTGRTLDYLSSRHSDLQMVGIEPVEAMRKECCKRGLPGVQILEGDANSLPLGTGTVDCVSLFGVLHHVPEPEKVVAEAFRVAQRFVLISDHNIYGMGSPLTKRMKQLFRLLGMRKVLKVVMTGGKGVYDTDWDGVFYPFSLLDYFPLIERKSAKVLTFSTKTSAVDLIKNASHVAFFALKDNVNE